MASEAQHKTPAVAAPPQPRSSVLTHAEEKREIMRREWCMHDEHASNPVVGSPGLGRGWLRVDVKMGDGGGVLSQQTSV